MMSRQVLFALGLVVGFAAGVVAARQGLPTVHAGEAPSAPPADAQLVDRAKQIIAQRNETINDLLAVIGSRDPTVRREDQVEAIDLLADLHATTPRVVVALADNLLLRRPGAPVGVTAPPLPWVEYPALGALGRVGLPAAPCLVHRIGSAPDERLRQMYLDDLGWLLGEHSKSWIDAALRGELNRLVRARLRQAATWADEQGGRTGAYGPDVWLWQQYETGPWCDSP